MDDQNIDLEGVRDEAAKMASDRIAAILSASGSDAVPGLTKELAFKSTLSAEQASILINAAAADLNSAVEATAASVPTDVETTARENAINELAKANADVGADTDGSDAADATYDLADQMRQMHGK